MNTAFRRAPSAPCLVAAGSAAARDYGTSSNLEVSATDAERAVIEALHQRVVPNRDPAHTEFIVVWKTGTYAEAWGFRDWDSALREVTPADRFDIVNRDRAVLLSVVGSKPIASGIRLINSSIDAIRLAFCSSGVVFCVPRP